MAKRGRPKGSKNLNWMSMTKQERAIISLAREILLDPLEEQGFFYVDKNSNPAIVGQELRRIYQMPTINVTIRKLAKRFAIALEEVIEQKLTPTPKPKSMLVFGGDPKMWTLVEECYLAFSDEKDDDVEVLEHIAVIDDEGVCIAIFYSVQDDEEIVPEKECLDNALAFVKCRTTRWRTVRNVKEE